MPKGRMLNKKISLDEEIAKLSDKAIILYTWCIAFLDVEGRINADPQILKGLVVPYLKRFNYKVIEKCVAEIGKLPNVVLYGNNHKYMQFLGFPKNQNINKDREAPSEIPPPTLAELQQNSCTTPAKDNISKDNISKDKYMAFENAIFTTWNSFVKNYPILSSIEKISPERRIHLKKRFANKHFVDNYPKAISLIKNYAFLKGENDRGWRISFDWLIANDNNYIKILEGRYKDKGVREFHAADPDCQICGGTGFMDIEGGGKTICSCRRRK